MTKLTCKQRNFDSDQLHLYLAVGILCDFPLFRSLHFSRERASAFVLVEKPNTSGEAVRGLVRSRAEFPHGLRAATQARFSTEQAHVNFSYKTAADWLDCAI